MFRPLPYTIYVNCRDKKVSVQARKDNFHPKEIIKSMRYRVSGRPSAENPQRPFMRGACH